jgi:DNA repair exonuclease SbcCD ATPase subunit
LEDSLSEIHRVMNEISEAKVKLKNVREQLVDILEQNDEYKTLKEELKSLSTKRAEIKKVLADDKDYQVFSSELEELRFKLKDLQEILSHHLVTYYNQTQNTRIKDQDGETRPVILSAKIGKPDAIISD